MNKTVCYSILSLSIIGIFSCSESNEVVEQKETGHLKIEQIQLTHELDNDSYDNSELTVQLEFPKLVRTDSNMVNTILLQEKSRRMNKSAITDSIFEDNQRVLSQLETAYQQFKRDFPEIDTQWYLDRKLDVVAEETDYLTLRFEESSFLGGAHPTQLIFFTSYDKKTGKHLYLKDLFTSNEIDMLKTLAKKQFLNQKGLKIGDDLEANGWFFPNGAFALSSNFCKTESTLILFYNRYDIGSYAAGATQLEIDLKNLVEHES